MCGSGASRGVYNNEYRIRGTLVPGAHAQKAVKILGFHGTVDLNYVSIED